MGDGLLYVEPLYVQAATGTSFPLLQQVIVSFGSQIAIAETLKAALDKVFEGDSGAETEEPEKPGTGTPNPGTGQTKNAQLADAIADAQKAYADGQAALAKGNFAEYGRQQDKLDAALTRAANLQAGKAAGGGGGGGATPTPTPVASPTPVPSTPPEEAPPAGST